MLNVVLFVFDNLFCVLNQIILMNTIVEEQSPIPSPGLRKITIAKQKQEKKEEKKAEKTTFLIKMAKVLSILLPPFIWLLFTTIWTFLSSLKARILAYIAKKIKKKQNINNIIHRRRFEQYVQYLKLDSKDLGFTNQVLYQQDKKSIAFYIPTYVTCKIKSIQDVSVQSLLGNVSCAMILNIYFGDIPEEVVERMQTQIVLQLNRGEALKLQEDGLSITRKTDTKSKFLVFTIRKIFLSSLKVQTLWTPFQIVELIITITLNTVNIPANKYQKKNQNSHFNEKKQYKVSFNCMRNSDQIPMSYAMDCVFGIYDLAQKKLEAYSSKYSSYSEVMHNFDLHLQKIQKHKDEKKKEKKQQKKKEQKKQKQSKSNDVHQVEVDLDKFNLSGYLQMLIKKTTSIKKQSPKKVKYFQYNHFIVPLYTYPGNAIASIFIPLFLLALVSLAIFFQQPQLSGRVDAIASMVLGYIALIPSIKGQLAPSSQLTIVQSVVYMQTMCCLLCLYESFKIYFSQSHFQQYKFIWNENLTFMICLCAHIITFCFISGVYLVHKLVWQPSYNNDGKVAEQSPKDNINKWINPYCDETFIKFNKDIKTGKYSEQQKQKLYIKPYKIIKKQEKGAQKPVAQKPASQKPNAQKPVAQKSKGKEPDPSHQKESSKIYLSSISNLQSINPYSSMVSQRFSIKQQNYLSKFESKKILQAECDEYYYELNASQYNKL